MDFDTKPTNLIEYTCVKKLAIKKEVVHCYEIASKSLTEIIASLVTGENFSSVVFVVCIDLSQPSSVISETSEWLRIIREEGEKFIGERMLNRQEVLMG